VSGNSGTHDARLDALIADVAALRQEASYATSGGEGMAAMSLVRAAQAKLANAYLAAASDASDPAAARAYLESARATMVDVLSSAHGPDNEGLLPSLAVVLERLGAATDAHHGAIAAAWRAEAERAASSGRAEDARDLTRRVRELFEPNRPEK